MAPTSSWTSPKSRSASGSSARRSGRGHGATTIEACSLAAGEPLPQRLGDERHHGVEQAERDIERLGRDRARHVTAGDVAVEPGLDLLDVPVGEVAPDEVVDGRRGLVQAEPLVGLGRLAHGRLAPRDDPAIGQGELVPPHHVSAPPASGRGGPSRLERMNRPAFQSLFAKLRPGANEVSRSLGSRMTSVPTDIAGDQGVAKRVGAVALDHLQRIDAVAERLGHLAVLGVAHGAVQVHRG